MVALTERAAAEVRGILTQQGQPEASLRVWIAGGGCSGFQYGMGLDNAPRIDDQQFDSHGVTVLVDARSLEFLDGAEIDFLETPMGGGFKINNPHAASTCGCGNSFHSDEPDGDCSSCSQARY